MSSPFEPSSESDPHRNPANSVPSDAPEPSGRTPTSGPGTSAVWLIVAGIVAVAAVVFAVRRGTESPSSEAVGATAPTIDVVPLTGDAAPLFSAESQPGPTAESASFGGITLLHFWGTWCPPCRMEYPELVEMVQEFASDPDFRFISVSCEPSMGESSFEELQNQTEEYYGSIGVDVPTYWDPTGRTRLATAAALQNPGMGYPTTLLIDRQGKIAAVWEGFTPSGVDEMRNAIAADLKKT